MFSFEQYRQVIIPANKGSKLKYWLRNISANRRQDDFLIMHMWSKAMNMKFSDFVQ